MPQLWTTADARIEIEEQVAIVLDKNDDLTLLLLYQILHDGRNFRMEGISARIDTLLRERVRARNKASGAA